MTIFFPYSTRYRLFQGNYYSTGGMNSAVLRRYSKFADRMIVGTRVVATDDQQIPKTYSLIDDEKISIMDLSFDFRMFGRIKTGVQQADYVIVRLPCLFGLIAAHYARKMGKPVLTEVVGNAFWANWYHSFRGKLIAGPMHLLTKHAIWRSDYVSYITESYLQGIYPTSGVGHGGLANIVLDDSLLSDSEILARRLSRIEDSEKITLGMIAKLTVSYKGHREALKVFSRLAKRHDNLQLELVGGGDPSLINKMCRKLGLTDRVVIKGSIPNESIFEWLDEVDIYLQPSKTEAQGRSIIEAMSRGCTVVTSDIGGMKETVADSFRFRLNDLDAFEKILETAFMDKNVRKQQAERNFKFSKKFTHGSIAVQRDRFFESIFVPR